MDDVVHRPTLVQNINSALSAQNVAISAARVAGLSARADFLVICRTLAVLRPMSDAQFVRYRRRINQMLTLPIRRLLTMAFRTSLYSEPPIPLHIQINPVTPVSVQVTHTDQLVSIILNRPDPPPFES